MPKKVPPTSQLAANRKRGGGHVTLRAVMPRVDNYTVRPPPPPLDQGGMDGNFYALVREAWNKSPRMQTGITTIELKQLGIHRVHGVITDTAAKLGCASKDHVFPLIKRNRCRPDLQEELAPKARLVPVWMVVFLLAEVRNVQFSKFNDRFRVVFDLLDEIQEAAADPATGVLEHVPGLVRESIVLAARKCDLVLESYHNKAARAFHGGIPAMASELRMLRSDINKLFTDSKTTRDQLDGLLGSPLSE